MEIKKTYDYSKFKFLSYNRAVGSNKKLMRSIEMANLTSVCPIIVTPKMEIIDGQNRFEVCKSKGMPIFYVVYEGDAESSNCTFMELKLKSSQASLEKSAQF